MESGPFTIYVKFFLSVSTLTGSGYMNGIMWKQPFEMSESLTKNFD